MKKISVILVLAMVLSTITLSFSSVALADTEARTPDIYITSQDYGNTKTTLVYQTGANTSTNIYNSADGTTVSARGINVKPSAGGFEIDANGSFANSATSADTLVIGASSAFANKAYRADSVKFKMPEYTKDEENNLTDNGYALLFAYSNKDYYNSSIFYSNIYSADRNAAFLKITKGGAYTGDINIAETASGMNGNRVYNKNIVPDNTLAAGKWYRAERIIDCRVSENNYQRFIIYDDSTNTVVGDSGWVWTGKVSKTPANGVNSGYAFANLGFGAWGFAEDSVMVIDEIKSYALDDAPASWFVGEGGAGEDSVYLRYPSQTTSPGTNVNAIQYQFHSSYRNAELITGMPSAKAPKLYAEQSFMLPAINTTEIRLFDLPKQGSSADATNAWTATNGTVYLKDGSLKVYGWNTTDGKYTTEVAFTDNTTSYTLEAGKWYNVRWTIDSSALTAENEADFVANAKIELMDENGTLLKETGFYAIKPLSVYNWSGSLYSFRFLQSDSNKYFRAGLDIALDNFKLVTSDDAMDSVSAVTYIDDDFQSYTAGTKLSEIIYKDNTVSISDTTKFTVIEVQEYQWDGIVKKVDPQNVEITFPEAMNKSILEDPEYVKIYAGESTTDDPTLINSLSYNETTKTLTIGLNTIAHSTTYTIKIDRAAATASGDIFSRIEGTDLNAAVYTFETSLANIDSFNIDTVYCMNSDETGFASTPIAAGQTIKVKAALSTNSEVNIPYTVIAAVYSASGELEDAKAASGVGSKADCEAGSILVPVPAITAETAGGYVKVFVWDSVSSMLPYGTATIYPAVAQ